MRSDVLRYLEEVRSLLHLDSRTRERVIEELGSHFEDKIAELREDGLTEPEAAREAIASFGETRLIARELDEAHAQGSWIEALLACQPHLLASALFCLHLWRNPVALVFVSLAWILIAVIAWMRGRPAWAHSWAGYAFFPLLVVGWMSRHLVFGVVQSLAAGAGPGLPAWELALLAVLWGGGLWLLTWALVREGRRDWIGVSLMLLPMPVFGVWLASVERLPGFLADAGGELLRWDAAMAWLCLLLGAASALFIRARSRTMKAGAVVAVGILCMIAILHSVSGEVGALALAGIAGLTAAFLLSPALFTGGTEVIFRPRRRRP